MLWGRDGVRVQWSVVLGSTVGLNAAGCGIDAAVRYNRIEES